MSMAGSYIGWVGHNNLGDEAIWRVCQERFPKVHWNLVPTGGEPSFHRFARRAFRSPIEGVKLLASDLRGFQRIRSVLRSSSVSLAQTSRKMTSGATALLGGGTIVNCGNGYFRQYQQARARLRRPVPIFGSGVYMPGAACKFPEWRDRRSEWVELFNDLPAVGVRGPDSKAALEDVGAKNVIVVGDPAIMFHRLAEPPSRESGKLRVGINCGDSPFIEWGTIADINAALVCTANALLQRGHSVELFSVWPPDQQVCTQIARECSGGVVVHDKPFTDPYQCLSLVRRYDLTVALKLHAGILSSAANVPAVFVGYQQKAHDFAASVGWEEYVVRGDKLAGDRLTELTLSLSEDIARARPRLCRNMRELVSRFESYCAALEAVLYK